MNCNKSLRAWGRPLLGALTFVFSIWVLYTTIGGNAGAALDYLTPKVVAVAALAVVVHGLANQVLITQWGRMVAALGYPLAASTVSWIWTRAQLTRFAIGSAGLVSRPVLAKRYGVPLRVGTATTLLETIWLMAMLGMGLPFAAYSVAQFSLLWWLAGAGCMAVVLGLTFFPAFILQPLTWVKSSLDVAGLRGHGLPITVGYGGQLLLRGLAFVMVAGAINPVSLTRWPMLIGAFVLPYLVGWLVIVSPGGLGPREAMAGVMLVQAHLTPGEILALVTLARLVEVMGELGVVAIYRQLPEPLEPPQANPDESVQELPIHHSSDAGEDQGANSSDE